MFDAQMTHGVCIAVLIGLVFAGCTANAEGEEDGKVATVPVGSMASMLETEAAKGLGWRGFIGFFSRAVRPSRMSANETEIFVYIQLSTFDS